MTWWQTLLLSYGCAMAFVTGFYGAWIAAIAVECIREDRAMYRAVVIEAEAVLRGEVIR